jgi:hypothetical protein
LALSKGPRVITINTHTNMGTKSPECWASDLNAEALRIEISPERSLLLPHDQFMFAELTSGGDLRACLKNRPVGGPGLQDLQNWVNFL